MVHDWEKLTELTGGQAFTVERIRLSETGIAIESEFDLPPLARLTAEDQVFLAAFVRSHGSIKQMEQLFGVSYPTIKNRLNRIGEQFDYVEIDARPERVDVLDRLERGELSVAETLDLLNKGEDHE